MRLVLLLAAALPLAAQCNFTITPTPVPGPTFSVAATAGSYTIDVQAPAGCGWTYNLYFPPGSAAWITITSGPPNGRGSGNWTIAWNAAANPYPLATRTATFTITPNAEQSYLINVFQSAPSCSLTLSPSAPVGIPVAGDSGLLSVSTNCAWSAGASASWIQLTNTSGTSSGTVSYAVLPNLCVGQRSGSITVVQTPPNPALTIKQDGSPGNLTISPASTTIPAAATTQPIVVQVNTGAGCAWSSSTNVSWLRVASGASGSGSTSMVIVANANPGTTPRVGLVTINNGTVFTLTQQGAATPAPQLNQIESAASFIVAADTAGTAGAVAPGEIVSLFGSNIGPASGATLQLSPDGRSVTNSLAGVQVLFDGTPAPLTYAGLKQINAVVPYAVADNASGSTKVQVQYQGTSNTLTVPVQAAVPSIFTADFSGRGAGAILNQDGVTLNTNAHPAPKGSIVSIYCTGGGATQPASADGAITGVNPLPLLALWQQVTVTIGGVPSPKVWYAGGAPGSIAGLTQINAEIPANLPSGPNALVVQIGNQQSQPGVVVYVQ